MFGVGKKKIEVTETGIRIHALHVENLDVARHLGALCEDQREQTVIDAIKIGVLCLERARVGQDLDFVRRELDGVLSRVKDALSTLPEETQKQVAVKIGIGEGQALAPINALVKEVKSAASDKIEDIRNLLQQEVDPTKESSSLGKALRALRDLLDPKRTDSIQGSVDSAVKQITGETGPLAKAVRDVISTALKPLEKEVIELAKEVRSKEAVAAALEQTTQKGASYEEEVLRVLLAWVQRHEAEVHHTGTDNQPGDILLVLPPVVGTGNTLRLVVEARDHQSPDGRKVISDCLNRSMAKRNASSAIYVSKKRDGLAKEIGEWAEGSFDTGCWVACTHEHLVTAVRFLVVQERLRQLRMAGAAVDASWVESQIERIRTSLGKIKNIKTKVTNIRDATDDIEREAGALRDDIKSALAEMEDALRVRRNGAMTDARVADHAPA